MERLDYEMPPPPRPSASRFNTPTLPEPQWEHYLSDYTGPQRQYLPEVLARVTHDGNGRGIGPTSRISENGDMHPRRPLYNPRRKPHPDHILNHLNAYKRTPTTFLSFGTWRCLSSRIASWEALGVQNMKLHLIQTSILPPATQVFKSANWAAEFSPRGAKPYLDGEYLIEGPIPAYSFLRIDLPAQGILLCPGWFLRSGIPIQDIPPCSEYLVLDWMQWGLRGLGGDWGPCGPNGWSKALRLACEPHRPNGETGLLDLFTLILLEERMSSSASRLGATRGFIAVLWRFLFKQDGLQIEIERQLRRS